MVSVDSELEFVKVHRREGVIFLCQTLGSPDKALQKKKVKRLSPQTLKDFNRQGMVLWMKFLNDLIIGLMVLKSELFPHS